MIKKYDGIDLMKFIASVFVLTIHTSPLSDINEMANYVVCEGIARLVVPLFFLSSAFLFYSSPDFPGKVLKYLKRMGKLYFCWFVIMSPITFYDRFIVSNYSLPMTIFRFFRSFFVTSTFSGSWFLCSCIFSVILFALLDKLNKKFSRIITLTISIAVYIFCVFTSAYGSLIEISGLTKIYNIYELFFANPYTSFLVSIPYFAIAKYLSKKEIPFKNINIYAVATFILLVVEIVITTYFELHKTTDCYFMLFPCSVLLFSIFKKSCINIKAAVFLRKMSTIIFFSHFIWIFVLRVIKVVFEIEFSNFLMFFITIALSLFTAKFIISLSNYERFKFLKYLY